MHLRVSWPVARTIGAQEPVPTSPDSSPHRNTRLKCILGLGLGLMYHLSLHFLSSKACHNASLSPEGRVEDCGLTELPLVTNSKEFPWTQQCLLSPPLAELCTCVVGLPVCAYNILWSWLVLLLGDKWAYKQGPHFFLCRIWRIDKFLKLMTNKNWGSWHLVVWKLG